MSDYYLPFDCETGGLDPQTADVLTLYIAVMDENFNIAEELDLKLKPDNGRLPIAESQALAVNKINLKNHLEDPSTITYSEAKEKVVAMVKKYLKKKGRYSNIRPLGQNVQFDIDFVQHYLIPKSEWNNMIHYAKIDTKTIVDFLKDCAWFPRDLGTLGTVVDFLQLPKGEAHNAKADTLMTVGVYKKILDIMKSKKEGGQSQDLISLLELE